MSSQHQWSDFLSGDRARVIAAANALLPVWVSLAIVLFIGWQLALIFWSLMPGSASGNTVSVPAGQGTTRTIAIDRVDVNAIAAASIFGKADIADEPVPVQDNLQNLDETNLRNLTLRGTIASDRPEYSIAIISDGNNEEKVYVIGDSVASGASLHAVYRDRVVLNERGVLTNLTLPREFASRPAPTVRRTSSTRQASNSSSIQSVVAQNVSRLADVIRPTPYFVNGQQQGYRVYPGRDRQQFASLGLRPGDLIKEIDGQSLTDPTQAMEIFQSLGTANQVSVTVERNGNAETLVLSTDQLNIGNDQTK
ncbi:MAG: type II secretion system protein GspC [Gammaproteobacteria bacterium]|nr:type II secretion system protein GspC [Gammaproteobacteria bacterium]NNC76683.1 type II secretion system protein GspC [Woeseiaceae bacterium]